jgi:iron(III) transport system permease protein
VGRALARAIRQREQSLVLAAAGVLVLVTALAPLAQLLVQTVATWPSGLAVLTTTRTWLLFARSLVLAGAVTCGALAAGVPIGVLLARADMPLRRSLWLIHALPMILPPFLPALGWFHLFGSQGFIGDEASARLLFDELGLVFVLLATFLPIVSSLTAVGVMGVDVSLEEAARSVAGPWRVASRILVPAAAPAIALAAVIVFALAFSELGVPMFLRVDVFPAAVFARLGGADFAPGEALALALPLIPLALALLLIERRLAGRKSFAVLGLRDGSRNRLALGRWRLPAVLLCGGAAVLSAVPIGALLLRAQTGGALAATLQWASDAPWNGLVASTLAASTIAPIGLVLGHAAARGLRGAATLDGLAMLTFVMPAAVLGVGLIGVWNRASLQPIYGSLAILVVGYVARYTAVGVRVVACAVAQSPVHLEEAAAASGARFSRRLFRIVLPVHARGVAFAWLMAVLFCLRDLETAVLFYPPGGEPLTVRIFTLEANGPAAIVAGLCALHIAIVVAIVVLGAMVFQKRGA